LDRAYTQDALAAPPPDPADAAAMAAESGTSKKPPPPLGPPTAFVNLSRVLFEVGGTRSLVLNKEYSEELVLTCPAGSKSAFFMLRPIAPPPTHSISIPPLSGELHHKKSPTCVVKITLCLRSAMRLGLVLQLDVAHPSKKLKLLDPAGAGPANAAAAAGPG